ncbi:MAG: exodeoxyribonuclease III, partial [Pseudomonadota bacterium]
NINSVRLRQQLVVDFLTQHQPDVLCLQETKTEDHLFPHAAFEQIGYRYRQIRGEKSYNGVAIIAKIPIESVGFHKWAGRDDTRHLMVRLPRGWELHNFYIPAGGDEPDPQINPKFAHKLQFVDELASWFAANRHSDAPIIAVGDFNIAPSPMDVWSHKQLLKIVSHTPVEVAKLDHARDHFGWRDLVRDYFGEEARLYSWWSYRARDWAASDRGRRLDHIWATGPVAQTVRSVELVRKWRGADRPSDHVPVIAEFAI